MLKRIFRNLYFLTFLNGFLLASLFYFKMEGYYENELFKAIRTNIDSKISTSDGQDSVLVKVMQACHSLLGVRSTVFSAQNLDGFNVNYLHPTSVDLMTAWGACGSYSFVLARILREYDFPVRIAQMKANGIFANHNVVEAKTEKGWVVLDPTFDVYFTKPSSGLASFQDVRSDWSYYKHQVPVAYDTSYRYEDVRYSNWGKIPVIMPALKKILDICIGKSRADQISLRIYFLKIYDFYFYLTLLLYIPILILTMRTMIKTRLFPQRNLPITVRNVVRHLKLKLSGTGLESTVNT